MMHLAGASTWTCFAWMQGQGDAPFLSKVRHRQLSTTRLWEGLSEEEDVKQDDDNDTVDGTLVSTSTRRMCVLVGSNDEVDMVAPARNLASKLVIPLIQQKEWSANFSHWDYALSIEPYTYGDLVDYAVAIQPSSLDIISAKTRRKKSSKQRKKPPSSKPFFVDLFPPLSSRLGRRTSGDSGHDLLVKAVGPGRKEFEPNGGAVVYDLTAGLGQDSLLLALAGATHVYMVERDPIVAALLEDAMRRLHLLSKECRDESQREQAQDLYQRLSLQVGDGTKVAQDLLKARRENDVVLPDIIYLDPMFPPRTKTALVKKNMQVLHRLLDSQENDEMLDNAKLLHAAYQATRSRLVVKRPINAPPLHDPLMENENETNGIQPSYAIRGKVNRWDVYTK